MFETLFCAMFTILPDYLYRRYAQGKRIGIEINFFSVWYELRWGLTACFIATIALITTLFYFHPSTNTVASYFRTVTILPEAGGRVAEIYVESHQDVKAGDPLFRLDSSSQEAAVATAQRRVDEVNAAIEVSGTEIQAAPSNSGTGAGGV